MKATPILSRQVAVATIPATGIEHRFEATDDERSRLATAYDLLSVGSLTATLLVSAEGKGGVAIEGRVEADIVQACVVTLEPVPQAIDEPIALRFAPMGTLEAEEGAGPILDPGVADPPEPLPGPVLDLGAIVEEHFALAIDPYPRAPGAELPAAAADADDPADSPFAALAGLRDKLAPDGGKP